MIASSTELWTRLTGAWIDAWLIENTLLAGLLTAGLLLVSRWVTLRPALSHTLWLCVIVKLCCPPLWRWSVPVPEPMRGIAAQVHDATVTNRLPTTDFSRSSTTPPRLPDFPNADTEEVASAALLTELPGPVYRLAATDLDTGARHRTRGAVREQPNDPALVTITSPPSRTWPTRAIRGGLAIGWGLGSLAALAWLLRGAWKTQRALSTWSHPPEHLRRSVASTARRLGVRAPTVRVVDGVTAPFLWSFGRPALIWPQRWLARGTEVDVQNAVLAHELAHYRRKDHWTARVEMLAMVAFWWHPLLWFARSRLREQAELACDAWAIWTRPEARHAYATALVDAVATARNPSLTDLVPAAPALGSATATAGRTFERRLLMILESNAPRRLSSWMALPVAAACSIALSGVTFAQSGVARVQQGQHNHKAHKHSGHKHGAAHVHGQHGNVSVEFAVHPDRAHGIATLPQGGKRKQGKLEKKAKADQAERVIEIRTDKSLGKRELEQLIERAFGDKLQGVHQIAIREANGAIEELLNDKELHRDLTDAAKDIRNALAEVGVNLHKLQDPRIRASAQSQLRKALGQVESQLAEVSRVNVQEISNTAIKALAEANRELKSHGFSTDLIQVVRDVVDSSKSGKVSAKASRQLESAIQNLVRDAMRKGMAHVHSIEIAEEPMEVEEVEIAEIEEVEEIEEIVEEPAIRPFRRGDQGSRSRNRDALREENSRLRSRLNQMERRLRALEAMLERQASRGQQQKKRTARGGIR